MLSSKSVALTTCIDFAIAVFSAITFVICWVWNTTVGKPPKPWSIIFSTAQISRVKGSPTCKVFLKRSLISYLWTRTQLLLYGDRNMSGNINNFFLSSIIGYILSTKRFDFVIFVNLWALDNWLVCLLMISNRFFSWFYMEFLVS